MKGNKHILLNLLIIVVSFLLFVSFLGGVHLFDWDEINFAESAREMIVTGDYLTVQINYHPFWEKPPLFIWMQVLSMKLFGINEFAARFPNAVCGVITLLILFNIGRKLYSNKFGLLWAMAFAFSILPFVYFKSGIIDPWFNLFIFLGIHYSYNYTQKSSAFQIIFSAAFIGLAILTKGPVALLIFLLTAGVYWIINRFKKIITFNHLLLYVTTLTVVGGIWFLLQAVNGNYSIIKDFIEYQVRLFQTEDAGHGGFFLYHFIVLLIGVFPASVFAIKGFAFAKGDEAAQKEYKKWMVILFWVVLVLFSIVKTKIVHYSSLCYFPLTFLCSLVIYKYTENKQQVSKWITSGILIVGSLITIVVASVPLLGRYNSHIIMLFPRIDEFTKGILLADVYWSGFESLVQLIMVAGMLSFIVLLKKKKTFQGIIILFISTGLTVYLTLLTYVTKIEEHSQGAVIEFFEGLKNKNVYVETLGYKSYAHLFYNNKKPPVNLKSYDKDWLLTGKIDKDVFFSAKITSRDAILKIYPEVQVLYEKNGFVFLVRRR